MSRHLIDTLIAPGVYDFQSASIPSLDGLLRSTQSWFADNFLNRIFRADFKHPVRAQAVNCIYRARAAIAAYQRARSITFDYLRDILPGEFRISLYFRALSHWESCLINWQILVEVYNRISPTKAFVKGDGSNDDRAYDLANLIKHGGATPQPDGSPTVPVWMTSNGLRSSDKELGFDQLATLLEESHACASVLLDPMSAGQMSQ
jgi:hypothetical protein